MVHQTDLKFIIYGREKTQFWIVKKKNRGKVSRNRIVKGLIKSNNFKILSEVSRLTNDHVAVIFVNC